MLDCKFAQNYTFTGGWVWVGGWILSSYYHLSQAKLKIGWGIGWAELGKRSHGAVRKRVRSNVKKTRDKEDEMKKFTEVDN